MIFKDRCDAGRRLAIELETLNLKKGIVIGLPRGGVPVAAEIAHALHWPLDMIIVRKIGAPFNPELAIGAIVEDCQFLNEDLITEFGIDANYIHSQIILERKEAARRQALYRRGRAEPQFAGQTIIVVDDGIATGATMLASLRYLKSKKAKRLIAAVPVAPPEAIEQIEKEHVETICLYSPSSFAAVGQFYESFPQVEDEEVIQLLDQPF